MLRVAAFTGGVKVPSARFRVRQYIPVLRQEGVDVQESISKFGKYPPRSPLVRPLWAITTLAERLPSVIRSRRYDAVLLQRELFSTFVTLERLTRRPRILDVDDAIFLHRRGAFARKLAELSDRVICGNDYLADWFCRWNADVVVIPTAVDSDRYVPKAERRSTDETCIIGWIGTSSNFQYLAAIEAALAKVIRSYSNARLMVVSNRAPKFQHLPPSKVDFVPWSEASEVSSIQRMDIGIMPLIDSPWARGKCSFKMLQYMACGIPVVVSPVGMNAEVLGMGDVGIGARDYNEWVETLSMLLDDHDLRASLGQTGRDLVLGKFSVRAVAPRLADVLKGT